MVMEKNQPGLIKLDKLTIKFMIITYQPHKKLPSN